MGAYICAICEMMFDSHDVVCHEAPAGYGKHQLICDDCQIEIEEQQETENK